MLEKLKLIWAFIKIIWTNNPNNIKLKHALNVTDYMLSYNFDNANNSDVDIILKSIKENKLKHDYITTFKNIVLSDRYVTLTSKNDEIEYVSNDIPFNVDFRNLCKDTIRNDMFERIGQQEYERRLADFEPDMFQMINDLTYIDAKCNYFESALEYERAINNPNYEYSDDLFRMWKNVERAEKNYKEIESELFNQ